MKFGWLRAKLETKEDANHAPKPYPTPLVAIIVHFGGAGSQIHWSGLPKCWFAVAPVFFPSRGRVSRRVQPRRSIDGPPRLKLKILLSFLPHPPSRQGFGENFPPCTIAHSLALFV